jgi:hypothetical protein
MQATTASQSVLDTCAACGGDPGGLVWEGLVLVGLLKVDDILTVTGGAVDRRTIVRLFRTGELRGSKFGKRWVIRASQFVADWKRLERAGPGRVRRRAPAQEVIAQVTPR